MRTREAAFLAAHPRMHCPACRKRVSPQSDNVNASDVHNEGKPVLMICPHCDHRWEVAREMAVCAPEGSAE